MANSKVIKSGKMTPVRGGSGHMAGKGHVARRPPGITGGVNAASGKWAKGGSSRTSKQGGSVRAKPE